MQELQRKFRRPLLTKVERTERESRGIRGITETRATVERSELNDGGDRTAFPAARKVTNEFSADRFRTQLEWLKI